MLCFSTDKQASHTVRHNKVGKPEIMDILSDLHTPCIGKSTEVLQECHVISNYSLASSPYEDKTRVSTANVNFTVTCNKDIIPMA